MKQLRRNLFYLFLLTSFCASAQDISHFRKFFRLMPQPQKVELFNVKGITAASLQSIYLEGTDTMPVLSEPLATLPRAQKPAAGVLALNISTGKNVPVSNEGYVME